MTILLTLFAAGVLTILLPCILPLVPIVLGVSLSGRNKWRPLVTATGMAVSFVAFTLVLQLLLRQFVQLADLVRVATYYTLLLFGICFVTTRPHLHGNPERVPKPSRALALAGKARPRLHAYLQIALAVLGALPFFWGQGWLALSVSPLLGAIAVALGGRVAARMQQAGARVQQGASAGLGSESLLSALVVGLTLGLVWVPCAGPALGFALTLVRDQPGLRAFLALTAYAVGAALPMLFIGYGGQRVVRGARGLIQYSGRIKQVSGAVLVLSALAFQFQWFAALQTWLGDHTSVATFGSVVEARLVRNAMAAPAGPPSSAMSRTDHETDRGAALPQLPKLARAPELAGLGPWYNSPPLTRPRSKARSCSSISGPTAASIASVPCRTSRIFGLATRISPSSLWGYTRQSLPSRRSQRTWPMRFGNITWNIRSRRTTTSRPGRRSTTSTGPPSTSSTRRA